MYVLLAELGNLKAKGYVRSEKRGKESWYDMAEPLMRLCLEIKNQRGRPLRLVAKFLRAWFPLAALFGLVDAMLDSCSLDDLRTALTHAFVAGDSKAAGYGGNPEDLVIPLRCLDAAVEVMKSTPRSDRALFRLPLEIRELVRPPAAAITCRRDNPGK